MKNCKKQGKNLIKSAIFCILALILCFMPFLFNIQIAYAEDTTTVYSDVMEDLSKDENFTLDDYPEDTEDYSLSVIQIAESSDNELFIYVYQPTGQTVDLRAAYVNMSLEESATATSIYSLTFLSSYQTLYKYKVEDVVASSNSIRYYNITSIYRETIEGIDETVVYEDQEISYISYNVGQKWEVYAYIDSLYYSCYATEVITVTDKYVGYIYYDNDIYGVTSEYRSHFVAFSTDWDIDNLLEATVYYESTYHYDYYDYGEGIVFTTDGPNEEVVSLYADEVVDITTGTWIHKDTFSFNQIQTISSFMEGEVSSHVYFVLQENTYTVLNDDVKEEIADMQYVLRFAETYYMFSSTIVGSTVTYLHKYTDITNVSILELTFETNGITYSLGVVDNMQTEGDEPSGGTVTEWDWADWVKSLAEWLKNHWQYLLYGLLAIIVLIILAPFIPSILSLIGKALVLLLKCIWWCLKKLGKGLLWLITAPFDVVKKE